MAEPKGTRWTLRVTEPADEVVRDGAPQANAGTPRLRTEAAERRAVHATALCEPSAPTATGVRLPAACTIQLGGGHCRFEEVLGRQPRRRVLGAPLRGPDLTSTKGLSGEKLNAATVRMALRSAWLQRRGSPRRARTRSRASAGSSRLSNASRLRRAVGPEQRTPPARDRRAGSQGDHRRSPAARGDASSKAPGIESSRATTSPGASLRSLLAAVLSRAVSNIERASVPACMWVFSANAFNTAACWSSSVRFKRMATCGIPHGP